MKPYYQISHDKNWSCFITDRVRSTREGYVLTRVCPSIHPPVCLSTLGGGGGTPARSRWGGQVPQPGPTGGYPTSGTSHRAWPGEGVPLLEGTPPQVPPIRPGGGTPGGGVPHLRFSPVGPGWGGVSHLGYPLVGPGWGYPTRGTPHLSDLVGGTPPWVADGVLDAPRSVCLLRSCRRTFLYCFCKIITDCVCSMRQEVIFSLCQSTPVGGVPRPGQDWGGYPSQGAPAWSGQDRGCPPGVPPSQVRTGGTPTRGCPPRVPPGQVRTGGTPAREGCLPRYPLAMSG